jgi:hypothetical protein
MVRAYLFEPESRPLRSSVAPEGTPGRADFVSHQVAIDDPERTASRDRERVEKKENSSPLATASAVPAGIS